MNKNLLRNAMEELLIEGVVQAIDENQPIEKVVEDIQSSVNDDAESSQQSDKAEIVSNEIDEAEKTAAALEQLAEIIQNTSSTGGLTPSSAALLNTSANAICKPNGFAFESIDPNNFDSYSKRIKYTLESVDNIKEMIYRIWKLIIDGLKKLIGFIGRVQRFFESDMYKYKAEIDRIKGQFSRVSKVTPENDTISGIIPQMILEDVNKNTSSDVVANAQTTVRVLTDFISTFRKDLGTAVSSINNFSDTVLDIPLSADKDLELFRREDLKNFGEFFGTHLSTRLKRVNDSEIPKPTNTMLIFESEVLAGNYKFTLFTPDRNNLQTDDILKSRIHFNVGNDEETPSTVEVCDVNHFRKIFSLTDDLIDVARRSFDSVDYMEKEVKKILNKAEAAYSKVGKEIYSRLSAGGIETNQRYGVPVYNELSVTLKRFYSDSSLAILRYITRYIKSLTYYLNLSLKEYA